MPQIGENMSHIFHIGILAYLIFIFTACGYKDNPFYGESPAQKVNQQESSQKEGHLEDLPKQERKNILFQEIDSRPTQSYEGNED